MSTTDDAERPRRTFATWLLAVVIDIVVYGVAFGAAVWVMGRLGCLPDPSK